jgi:preprotein translocase subunit SecY
MISKKTGIRLTILFTLLLAMTYRFAFYVPLPGIDEHARAQAIKSLK